MTKGSRENVRIVRAFDVSPARSQAIYHAVGEMMAGGGPDTILLVRPALPYVCIGFHQDIEREVDLDACIALGMPIIRREVGGGTVLLDQHQVFVQWVFRASSLPVALEDRYRLFIDPLVATYRSLGIEAVYRAVNDIHVAGRKIGGTGAARIGESEILVGSIMFDFDPFTMSRVIRVSSDKMRDKVVTTMQEYVTSLRRELGTDLDQDIVLTRYLENASESLGRPLATGELGPSEALALARWEERLRSASWTYRRTSRSAVGVKVHQDITVLEGVHKSPAGVVQLITVVCSGLITEAQIYGDFTLLPQSALATIEASLKGIPADPTAVTDAVRALYADMRVDSPGLQPEDFGAAMSEALGTVTPVDVPHVEE
jgi:lipoate-protein ligase A